MSVAQLTYENTEHFPKKEIYGLVSQMRRASISIPSNIAEGSKRRSEKEYKHFLFIAYGSGAELETQIELSKKLGMIKESKKLEEMLNEVMKMLNTMTREHETKI